MSSRRLTAKEKDRFVTHYRNIMRRVMAEHLAKFPVKQEDFLGFYWGLLPARYKEMVEELEEKLGDGPRNPFCKTGVYLRVNTQFISKEDNAVLDANFTLRYKEQTTIASKYLHLMSTHPLYDDIAAWGDELNRRNTQVAQAIRSATYLFNTINTTGQLYRVLPQAVEKFFPNDIAEIKESASRSRLPKDFYDRIELREEIDRVIKLYTFGLLMGKVEEDHSIISFGFREIAPAPED